MKIDQVTILKMPVHLVGMKAAIEYIKYQTEQGEKQFIIAQNPEKIMKSLEDSELAGIIKGQATLLIADGIGLVVAGKLLGLPPIKRVTGVGLFTELLKLADDNNKRVFLYGASPEVINKAGAIIRSRYSKLTVAGIQDGYEQDEEKVIAKIVASKSDYLFVALGSPKQEKWIAKHLDRLPIQCAMGVGGSFDVLTGKLKRAPIFMQNLGLEWLHRLISQPTRAKRMLNLPRFLWRVIKSR